MRRRDFLLGAAAAVALRGQSAGEDLAGAGSVVFVQDDTVWIRRLPDGAPRAVAAGKNVFGLKFSPSGEWLVFHGNEETVRLISADGTISKSWQGIGQWLPGKDHLAVTTDDRSSIFGPEDGWTAPQIAFDGSLLGVSPDGKQRVWIAETDRKRLMAGPPDGSARAIAETVEGGFELLGFLRDNRFLYWTTDEEGADVWSYPLDIWLGGGEKAVPTGLKSCMGEDNNMVSLCAKTGMLALTSGDDKLIDHGRGIVTVDVSRSGFNPRQITKPDVSAVWPAWSPDGEKLAWTAAPDSERLMDKLAKDNPSITWGEVWKEAGMLRRIWIASGRGADDPVQLTNDDRYEDHAPIWSRDGRYILFSRLDRDLDMTVWLMRADGSGATQVGVISSTGEPGMYGLPGLFDWSERG